MSAARPPESTAPPGPGTWLGVDWSAHVHDATVAGRRVRYADYGAGPAIVLVHGLGGSWQTWLKNIPALAGAHRVIAVDLPGFGASEALAPPAAMATHARVIATLLDGLGVRSATFVGHSMGGLVNLQLVAARPDLVDRLVLANAGGIPLGPVRLALIVNGFRLFHLAFARTGALRLIARRARLRRLLFGGFMGNHHEMTGPFALEVIPVIFAEGFVGAVVAASKVAGLPVRTDEITCPVLLVWGAKDRILPLADARVLGEALLDGRLVVLDGVGHCPMFEAPDAFNAAVLAFIRTTEDPR
jgi:pimeloyl-ACP methyl ester carboxylesterase